MMLLDYAGNGNPDAVIWADEHGNEYDLNKVIWVDNGGTRETIVWQKTLELILPNGYNWTLLQTFIEARNPDNLKYINITIEKGAVVGTISSGDLSAYTEVTLINYGEIQGNRNTGGGGDALNLSSKDVRLKLMNYGYLRGAGGRGGHGGGSGGSSTDGYSDSTYYINFSGSGKIQDQPGVYGVYRYDPGSAPIAVGWYWNGVNVGEQPAGTEAWVSLPRNGDVQYFRSLAQTSYPGTGVEGHPIMKRTYTTTAISGVVGGTGGYGRGFKAALTAGGYGSTSGGVTGGRGGAGGDWGRTGARGAAASNGGTIGLTSGSSGGTAIDGVAYLHADSETGGSARLIGGTK